MSAQHTLAGYVAKPSPTLTAEQIKLVAYEFTQCSQAVPLQARHAGKTSRADLVESCILTPELAARLGVPAGSWRIVAVVDDETFQDAQRGQFEGFEIPSI